MVIKTNKQKRKREREERSEQRPISGINWSEVGEMRKGTGEGGISSHSNALHRYRWDLFANGRRGVWSSLGWDEGESIEKIGL